MKRILLIAALILGSYNLAIGQIGIGTTSPDPSSVLDVSSSDRGVLLPRMTAAQRDAIVAPANGLMVYITDTDEVQMNANNSAAPVWRALSLTPTSPAMIGDSVKYSNTDTTTDVNQATAIDLPVFGTLLWNDDATLYVVAGDQVTIAQTGRYEVIVNVSLINATATDRNAPEIRLTLDGTEVGAYGSTGYIRSNSNHEESSLHLREVLDVTAGQVLAVNIVRAANTAAVNLRSAGSTNIYVEKKL